MHGLSNLPSPMPALSTQSCEAMRTLLRRISPVSSVTQSRVPIFPVSAKRGAGWSHDNSWGTVRVIDSKVTQTHQDVLEAIHVHAKDWHVDSHGQLHVLFSDTDVLKTLGESTTNRNWLLAKLDELRAGTLEFALKNGRTVRQGILARHEWSHVMKTGFERNRRCLENFANVKSGWQVKLGLAGTMESAGRMHVIVYTAEYGLFFLWDMWMTRGGLTKTLIRDLRCLSSKALARYLLAEKPVEGGKRYNLKDLLTRLGILLACKASDSTAQKKKVRDANNMRLKRMLGPDECKAMSSLGIEFSMENNATESVDYVRIVTPTEVHFTQLNRDVLELDPI